MSDMESKTGAGLHPPPSNDATSSAHLEASGDESLEESEHDATDPQTSLFDLSRNAQERDHDDDVSEPADDSEDSAVATSDPAGAFISADEAAAAAFGPEDLGDGVEKAESEAEEELAVRIPVDWGCEVDFPICGLRNLGNTCFLNSICMLLVNCPAVFWHCFFAFEQKENTDELVFYSRCLNTLNCFRFFSVSLVIFLTEGDSTVQ
jgi:hypothetical protein